MRIPRFIVVLLPLLVGAALAACGSPDPEPVEQVRGLDRGSVEQPGKDADDPPDQLASADVPADTAGNAGPIVRSTMDVDSTLGWLVEGRYFPSPPQISGTFVSETDVDGRYQYSVTSDRVLGSCVHMLVIGGDSYELRSDGDESFVPVDAVPVDWELQDSAAGQLIVESTTDDLGAGQRDLSGDYERFGLTGQVLADRFGFFFARTFDPADATGSVELFRSGGETVGTSLFAEVSSPRVGVGEYESREVVTISETVEYLPANSPRIDPSMTIDQLPSCGPTEVAPYAGTWVHVGTIEAGELTLHLADDVAALQTLDISADGVAVVDLGCGPVEGALRTGADQRIAFDSGSACRAGTHAQLALEATLIEGRTAVLDGPWLWLGDHVFAMHERGPAVPMTRLTRPVDLQLVANATPDEAEAHGWRILRTIAGGVGSSDATVTTALDAAERVGESVAWVRLGADGWHVVTSAAVSECPVTDRYTDTIVHFDGSVTAGVTHVDVLDICLDD